MDQSRSLRTVIVALSLILLSSVPISTVYADIMQAFDGSPGWALNLMTVAPNLMNMAATAVSGLLLKRIPLRRLTLTAVTLLALGGILPIVDVGGLALVIFSRCLVGLCCGVLTPLVTVLAVGSFDASETDRIMGLRAAAQAIGSMVMFLLTMVLVYGGWRWAFGIYFLAIPALAVVGRRMPAILIDHNHDEPLAGDGPVLPERGMWQIRFQVCVLTVAAFVYMVCLNTLAPSLSMFLAEENIGAATLSGIGMCAYMLSGFVCGMCYQPIAAYAGRFTVFVGAAATSAGIAVIAVSHSLIPVFLGCALEGVGFAVFNSSGVLEASRGLEGAPKRRIVYLVLVAMGIGSFLSPFIADWLSAALIGRSWMRGRFLVALYVSAGLSLLLFLYGVWACSASKKQ